MQRNKLKSKRTYSIGISTDAFSGFPAVASHRKKQECCSASSPHWCSGPVRTISNPGQEGARWRGDNAPMDDPFLNYFALFMLFFVVFVMFYGIIAIHDIPHRIAESRHHPHQDAIHAAGWVSMFTLHALWPFLWIWAMAYRPERGWGFASDSRSSAPTGEGEFEELRRRLTELECKLDPAKQRELETARGSVSAPADSVSLQEDVVLPAAHAEKNLSQQGKVVQMLGVDGDLTRRTKG